MRLFGKVLTGTLDYPILLSVDRTDRTATAPHGAGEIHTMGKSQKLTANVILGIVQSRSEWAARATSVANPERATGIDANGKLVDATGTVLRAYVNASGVATLETNAEYKIRKGIRAEAKASRKGTMLPVGSVAVAAPAPAGKVKGKKSKGAPVSDADATIAALRAEIATLRGVTIIPGQPASVERDETGATPSATKNATIRAIDNKLATLGKTREYAEKNAGFPLESGSVRALREVNRILGERIAKNARKGN
jgi:hypothetical protein